jgi:two-component system, chemotaxis family, protein-glutamate methylesterase/glutaminase
LPVRRRGPWRAVVTGGSSGGMEVLETILPRLPAEFSIPILAVQHLHPTDGGYLARYLDTLVPLTVQEASDKEPICPGHVYLAPANYHLLVERDETLALAVDEKVNWSRPSIDVLFESAASVWGDRLVAVILSGSNHDGAAGARRVQEHGGLVVVQDPETALQDAMPRAAIKAADIEVVLSIDQIADFLLELGAGSKDDSGLQAAHPGGGGHG